MDEILLLLARKMAHRRPVRITTSELGSLTGMSQQNASRKLSRLEKEGSVVRGREGLSLTKKAVGELEGIYSSLRAAFEGGSIEIIGNVVRGLGEGRFYVSLEGYKSQFKSKLGFEPYPGTLNIRIKGDQVWKRQHILGSEPIAITGFRGSGRTYGDIFAYRCHLEGRPCAIIVPLRTHHGSDIIEIICPFDAKKELSIKDGDTVRVAL